jgi:2-polyprenyl-6-methoxyphenol hydroxylase-like FAD-dependent oxidoreductase
MSPILIVGAGPVGLTMAAELARYGVPVRIVDRAAQATSTSKALVLWARTLELMDRMGCTQSFLDNGLRAHGATMRSGSDVLGRTRFDDVASTYNFALMIPQRDTERLLTAHLATFDITVERELELTAFSETVDHVEATLRHADGREETVVTPWLLGCDGAHSAVRHGTGITFDGSTQSDDWLLADVRMQGEGTPPQDEVAIYFHADGPFVLFPMPGERMRVVGCIGKTDPAHPRAEPTMADVQAMIDRRTGGGFRVTDPAWLTNFRINERKVADYRQGRVFLAGDAAHIHSPAGGQGMNTGMQDAINLAWKLAMVVSNKATAGLLDSYSAERSRVGTMVLRNATRMTDAANLSHPAAQAARNLALRVLLGFHVFRSYMSDMLSEIEIAYAGSPLSVGSHAGDRLPPEHYAGATPGIGDTPRFVLYAVDKTKGSELIARHADVLERETRTPPDPQQLLIVRPDGYVGLLAQADDWNAAASYLDRLAR